MSAGGRRPRAVVFDLDGTLIDSAPDIAAALNHALALEGLEAAPLEAVRGMIGDGVRALILKALRRLGLDEDPQRRERLYQAFQAYARSAPVTHTTVFDGMTELIARMKAQGMKLGICTNKTMALAKIIVAALPFGRDIDDIVGGDGPFKPKPDPAGLLACIANLGVEVNEAAYVGDMRVDWLTARGAGVGFIGVDHGHWPYDDHDLGRLAPLKGASALSAWLFGAATIR
jgi:phosphoglycolate phosphatase